jgi:xanthine dehydrogenase accessory factor
MELSILSALNAERAARRASVLVTTIESGAQRLVKAADIAADPLADVLDRQLRMAKSAMVEVAGAQYFLTVQAPHPRIVITGAVHVSQAMAPMAKLLDLDLVIIDPRTAFATSALSRRAPADRMAGRGDRDDRARWLHGVRRADA